MQTQHGIKPQDVLFVALGVVVGAIADLRGASDMRRRGRAEIAIVLDLADKRALSIQTLRGRTRALSQPAAGKGRRSCLPRALGEPASQILAPGKTFDGAGKPLDMFPSVPNAREQAAPATSPASKGE